MTKQNTKNKCTRAKTLLRKATTFVMVLVLALALPITLAAPADLPFDSGVITVKAEYAVINKPMEDAVMNWINSEIKEGRTGIEGHEFEIGDCDEFRFFSAYVSNCHMVTACAILKCSPSGIKTDTTQESWLKIKSWLPIGTAQHPYKGTFSGLHKSGDDGIYRQKISGTFLIDGQGEYQGIFGYVADVATIKYVEVDNDSTVTGSAVAYGGIAGVNYGTIDNCGAPGVKVSGYGSESYHATQVEACVGGIAGINYGTVKNCTVSGETLVLGPKNVGCFVGINYGTVSDCKRYNGAPRPLLYTHRQDLLMQNGICVGGIVGTNYGTVERCENDALVVGKEKVGGVVGANYNTVKDCSNAGYIIGGTRVPEDVDEVVVGSQVGGVVGMNAAEGTIENSFHFRSDSWNKWPYEDLKDGYITATGASHVGCLVGQNEGKVENCYYVGNCNDEGTVFDCQAGEEKSQEKFASGEICYLLNNDVTDGSQAWYQDLTGEFVVGGERLIYPYLVKEVGTVYASSPCAIYFSNHSEDEKITTELPHEITSPWDTETHTVTCDTCHMTVRDKDTPEFDPTYKDKESGEPITEFLDTIFSNRSVEVTVAVSDPKKDPDRMVVPSGIDCERGAIYQIGSNGTKTTVVPKEDNGVLTFKFDVSGAIDDNLYFTAYDQAGCEGVKKSHIVIETDAPKITDQSNYGTEWINHETLTVGAKDTGSGLRRITYTVDDGSEVNTLFKAAKNDDGITTQKDVEIPLEEENHTYHISVTDNCGNTATKDITVNMDKTGPKINTAKAENADVLDTSAKITVSASDERGIEGCYLVYSEEEITATAKEIAAAANQKTVTEGKIAIDGLHANRDYNFALVVKDKVGNLSAVKSGTFKTAKTDLTAATVTLGTTSYNYDGTAREPVVTVKLGGTTIASDQYGISYENSAAGDGTEAANVRVGTVTVTVTASETGDYIGTATQKPTFTINKAAPSAVTAPTAKSGLTYNGKAQALVDEGSASGGTMKYSTSQTGEYSTTIPTGKDAKEYSVWYKVEGDANHTDTAPVEIKVKIAPLNITNQNPTITLGETLTYTGAEQTQTVSGVTCNGLPVTYTVSGNTGTDAGEDYELTVTGTGNFTGTATTGFSIGKKSVTGTDQSLLVKPETDMVQTIDYDLSRLLPAGIIGTTNYEVGTVTDEGGVLSAVPTEGAISADGKLTLHVASDAAIIGNFATVEIAFDNANYEISNAILTIKTTEKIPVMLSGVTFDERAYNGTAYEYAGTPVWKTGYGIPVPVETEVTYYTAAGDTLADAPTDAGSYRAEFTITSDDYEGTESFKFDITKAEITVAVKDRSIYTGDAVPDLANPVEGTDYTVTGLCGTDVCSGTALLSYGQEPDNTKVGTYDILIRGLTAPAGDNYTITFTKGTLTIAAKTPVILSGVTCGDHTYNGNAYAYTGTPVWTTADGETPAGETKVFYYKAEDPSTPVDAPVNAGSYLAVFTFTSNDYEGTASYSFEIAKAEITVAAKDRNIYTGDAVPKLANPVEGKDYTVTGLCGTDVCSGTALLSYGQTPDKTKAGTYDILIRGLTAPAGDNYTITFKKGTLTITAKPSSGGGGSTGGGGGSSSGGGGSSGGASGGGAAGGPSDGGNTLDSSTGGEGTGATEGSKPESSDNTTTITNVDGSTTTTTTETDANGNTVTTTTTVATDGSTTEKVQATGTNAAGKEVEVTTTTKTDADGNVTSVTGKSVIDNIEKNTTATVTVKTDGDGNVTSANANITKTGDSSKVSLSGKVLGQITEAAGADTKVRVTMTVKDREGNTKYKVQANADEIIPGEKLYIYKRNTKTGKYTMVNAKEYKVTKAGTVTVNMSRKATYELVTEQDSKAIEKAILATVKPANTGKSLSTDKTTTFKLSKQMDMDNVKSITYATSRKSIAAISKKGTITAVNAGTATVTATITLKNGTKKTVKMTIKVK